MGKTAVLKLIEDITHYGVIEGSNMLRAKGVAPHWRDHITHVLSDERPLIKHLSEIQSYIWPYLETVGVKLNISQRVGRWLKQWYSSWELD